MDYVFLLLLQLNENEQLLYGIFSDREKAEEYINKYGGKQSYEIQQWKVK